MLICIWVGLVSNLRLQNAFWKWSISLPRISIQAYNFNTTELPWPLPPLSPFPVWSLPDTLCSSASPAVLPLGGEGGWHSFHTALWISRFEGVVLFRQNSWHWIVVYCSPVDSTVPYHRQCKYHSSLVLKIVNLSTFPTPYLKSISLLYLILMNPTFISLSFSLPKSVSFWENITKPTLTTEFSYIYLYEDLKSLLFDPTL